MQSRMPRRVSQFRTSPEPSRAPPLAAALQRFHVGSASTLLPRTLALRFVVGATPNLALNRTFCGMRPLGFISFSPNSRMPQNAG